MTTEARTGHPFYMYDHIQAGPEVFAETTRRNLDAADRFAAQSASWRQVFLVGIGTSYHAARIGEYLVRAHGGGLPVRAWHSFDFALYGPDLSPADCVVAISHRGTKQYSVESARKARLAGCRVGLVTGEGEPAAASDADAVFHTSPQERSSAHTMSFVGSLAVLGLLADRVGAYRGGAEPATAAILGETVPDAVRTALSSEPEVRGWAGEHVDRRRIWLVGGGPCAVAAEEVALKIKETSYLQAEGMSVETMLHGPLQCVEPRDVFVLIAPSGRAQGRVAELARLLGEIGVPYVVVGDPSVEPLRAAAAGYCVVPEVPEPWGALTCLVPLQLFAYHLAIERGTNPDSFRLDDARFARASQLVRL